MPTRYPTDLPPVPNDRWNACRISESEIEIPDEGWGRATTHFAIDASNATEAEKRLLAWIDHDAEDDLRRATAEATAEAQPGRWEVVLTTLGEY
ncbi:hypothetical protein [Kitasatospora kifunensis]|uniref:Uncharacterized protein n=1 Tax=Kitasatospora kifunensis TaxID=58351 RepID=A0A7W7RBS7_KITKI|nr:hypothetical protein [Kitasatospora kifunensis]MBB4929110.1 hypothetical protein [Kitasatospora kifunensis]